MHLKFWVLIMLLLYFWNYFVHSSFMSNFLSDFVEDNGKNVIVTEYSCNKKDSADLFKKLLLNGYATKIMSVNTKDIFYPVPPFQQLFIINLYCQNSTLLLNQIDDENLFDSPFRWLAYYDSNRKCTAEVLNILSKFAILVDSDFNLAKRIGNDTVVVQKLFKKHILYEHFEIEPFGTWTRNTKFKKEPDFEQEVMRRRKNLGVTLKACLVVTHNDSLKHLTDGRDKHIDSIAKVNYILVMSLAAIYNISLNFTVQNTWGYKDNNSRWSGMMGELTRKEVDIGGTSLFLTRDRVDLIDYIAMVTPTRSKFVFRQPKLSYVTNVYTLPFDTRVWLSISFVCVIMMFALYILMKWEWRKKKYVYVENVTNSIELKDSLQEVAFLTFSALCQQGASAVPFSAPGRIATIFLMVTLMFIYVSYSANIVALLQTSSNSIKSLEDLLNSRLQVGVDDTVYNRYYFSSADERVRKAIYQKKVAPPGKKPRFMPIEDGVRKVRDGLFAFHMETGAGYKLVGEIFTEDEKCGLQEIAYLQVVDPWFAIQKNSSYKEMLKIGLRILQESGIQQRENLRIYTRRPVCITKGSTFFSVGIIDCYPVYLILIGGIMVALITFLGELYLHKRILFYKKYWRNHFDQLDHRTSIAEDLLYYFYKSKSKNRNTVSQLEFVH